MTLNMPQLLNSFPTSAAAGEGFESQYVEKFFLEATGIVPIGAVVAWCKSFPGVPALAVDTLFVECNGQVLNDPSSLLDGQTIPDLNGSAGTSRFLRGKTTSGGTGGSETHTHNTRDTANYAAGGGGGRNDNSVTESTSTLPSYYEVVWIMRVK